MGMMNTVFKIVLISRQGGRTFCQGRLHREFPLYLFYSLKMCACMYKANTAAYLKLVTARGTQNMILHTSPVCEMLHNKNKSYNPL